MFLIVYLNFDNSFGLGPGSWDWKWKIFLVPFLLALGCFESNCGILVVPYKWWLTHLFIFRFCLVNIACQLLLLLLRMLLDLCFCHLTLMLLSKVHCWILNFPRWYLLRFNLGLSFMPLSISPPYHTFHLMHF